MEFDGLIMFSLIFLHLLERRSKGRVCFIHPLEYPRVLASVVLALAYA